VAAVPIASQSRINKKWIAILPVLVRPEHLTLNTGVAMLQNLSLRIWIYFAVCSVKCTPVVVKSTQPLIQI
jgi:hypothetical protein